MKYKMTFALQFFLTLSIVGACSKQSNKNASELERQFLAMVPIADMNKSLQLSVYGPRQYYLSGAEIQLIVEDKSSRFISFGEDMFILLRNTDSQWTEVKNAVTYSSSPLLIAPPNNSSLNFQYLHVRPILDEDSNTFVPLRIVIVGEILNGNRPTGQKVGAYIDVSIKPTKDIVTPTTPIIYSTEETTQGSEGRIEGVITSSNNAGMPLSNVIVNLQYHPAFNKYDLNKVLATTTTDSQGRYSFDNVAPGIYALGVTLPMKQGGACDIFDMTKIIRVKVGVVATVNLGLACPP